MNITAWPEFELANHEIAVHYVNHYSPRHLRNNLSNFYRVILKELGIIFLLFSRMICQSLNFLQVFTAIQASGLCWTLSDRKSRQFFGTLLSSRSNQCCGLDRQNPFQKLQFSKSFNIIRINHYLNVFYIWRKDVIVFNFKLGELWTNWDDF